MRYTRTVQYQSPVFFFVVVALDQLSPFKKSQKRGREGRTLCRNPTHIVHKTRERCRPPGWSRRRSLPVIKRILRQRRLPRSQGTRRRSEGRSRHRHRRWSVTGPTPPVRPRRDRVALSRRRRRPFSHCERAGCTELSFNDCRRVLHGDRRWRRTA